MGEGGVKIRKNYRRCLWMVPKNKINRSEKWGKKIQTASYNGARMVDKNQ